MILVELSGWELDPVLAALGIAKPDGVEVEVVSEDLGQGETEMSYSTYVRGVIVDGDRGESLTSSGGSAVVIEGWVWWPTSS